MNYRILLSAFLLMIIVYLPGCSVVETIFEAGVWTGVILVIVILALVVFGIVKLIRKMK